jgi:Caspase domain
MEGPMKAIEKLLDILPVPLLAAVAAIVLLGWLFKELTQRVYGDVLRDPYFQAAVVVVCAAVGVYYALSGIFSQTKPFASNERGILIAKFEGDSTNTARIHTVETLKTRIGEDSEFGDVRFRALDKSISAEDGKSLVKDQNAIGIVTGSYVPPPNAVVHYQLYWRGTERVARLTADKFPDIKNFEEQFVKQIRSVPTAANLQASTLENLQTQISALKEENDRLLNLLLTARGSTATLPGSTKSKMYILAIGISDYANRVLRLRYASQDAQQIAKALSKSAGFEAIEVNVLIDGKATRFNILQQLRQILNKATNDDYFNFYFAGHSANTGDEIYLLPVDAAADSVFETGLSLKDVIRIVSSGRLKQALFFFDSTLSGVAAPSVGPFSFEAGLRSDKAIGLMFAGSPGQANIEDEGLGGGLFTYYLIRGIQGAAAGANGVVTLAQLQYYVGQSVRQATKEASNPLLIRNAAGANDLIVAVASAVR